MKNKIQSLFWGIIVAGTALFLELLFSSFLKIDQLNTFGTTLIILIIFSVLIEELLKYTVILKSIAPISFGANAIINAWIAGVGFSLVEIFIFYQKFLTENIIFNQIDLIKISSLHILTFGIFGYRAAIKRNNDLSAIISIILLHFAYNISTQYPGEMAYFIGNMTLAVLILWNIFNIITVNKRLAHE